MAAVGLHRIIEAGSPISSCVDSINVRHQMFRYYREHDVGSDDHLIPPLY